MWMLQKNHGEVSTMTKIIHFFPSRVTLYRGCSRRELDLMRKCHYEFKQLAQTLLFHKEMRKAYIRDQMEEQYGERYAQKLEERLFDYLQKLEKDLPPSTCIDQVLRQERPLVDGEQLLLGVLSCSPHSVPAALKRLIFYARVTPCTSPGMSQPSVCADEEKPTPQPLSDPKDSPKQTLPPAGQVGEMLSSMSHSNWKGRGEVKTKPTALCSSWYCVGRSERAEQRLRERGSSLGGGSQGTREHCHKERGLGQDERGWGQKEKKRSQEESRVCWGRTKLAGKHGQMGDYPMQLCSRHQRWARNILQECTVELGGQSAIILKEYPKEMRTKPVSILEHPKEVGCQTVNILEKCSPVLELVGQSLNILGTCSQELEGQSASILGQCPKEVGCQSVSILERCSPELVGQSALEECPSVVMNQGVIELQQAPLSSVHPVPPVTPVTPPHQYCSPRSYQRCGRDTAASLARVETAGLGVQISLESQLVLIRSQMLQPTVWVRRLTQRECHQATGMRGARIRPEEDDGAECNERKEEGKKGDSGDWESDFSYSESDEGSDSDSDYSPV
ncbi:uncharacterized protein LOC133131415 isoform X2 [Conger conger]|nr:uncharacterized protein LOC133131415 isoform X2 [Conger conger]